MKNYFNEYNSAQDSISLKKQTIIKNHISHYPVLEELLGFQYYLNRKFTEFFNSLQDPTDLKKFQAELFVYLLFFYNTQSLQTAFNALECDTIHQSAVNIRTVYESIPKMYYISLFPEEVGKITVHEYICDLSYEEALKELKGEDCMTCLDGQELKFETKNDFYNFKREYAPNAFRSKLYTKQHKILLQNLYSKFSNSTHPNITRNNTSVIYDSANTDLFFEFLKSLSYFNIESYLEGSLELLRKIGLDQEIVTFLNRISHEIKTIYEDVYFFPDKDNLKRKLKTSPTPSKK